MINNTTNNKLYFFTVGLLCTLAYLLNYCTAIYQCALIFTLIATTVNVSTYTYGKSKTLKGLILATLLSFFLLWDLPYHINGKLINGLAIASFSAVMISMYWSASVFQKLSVNLVL